MEGFQNTYNVTMQAMQYLTQAYTFVYTNLKDSNIPIPAPEQVVSLATSTVSYILSHSPNAIRQSYASLSQLPFENNFMTVVLLLVILYIVYSFVMATFLWAYRLVYGFVRFSLIFALVASLIYVVQYYLAGAALFPGSTTSDRRETRSFDHL